MKLHTRQKKVSQELNTWMDEEMDKESERKLDEIIWELSAELQYDPEFKREINKYCRETRRSETNRNWLYLTNPAGKALAAVAAIILMVGALYYIQFSRTSLQYTTDIGEQHFVTLEDGSTISINTNSELEIHYSDDLRLVSMTRGEAIFHVAPDPHRPFEVHTNNGVTRAIGTIFNVAINSDLVSVSVLEGMVEVETDSQKEKSIVQLKIGDAVNYLAQGVLTPVQPANIKRIRSWEEKKLYFEDTPLQEMVNEYNRYSKIRLVLANSDYNHLPVSGVFRIGNLESLLFTLQEVFAITHIKQKDRIILFLQSNETIMSSPVAGQKDDA